MFPTPDIRGTSQPRKKYFARLFLQNTVPNSAGRMRRYLRCLVWETPRSVLAPRPFNWFQCVRAPKKSHFDRARASQTPRWPHTARRCTGTPQMAQNTTASHQKRALVGGWSINTALPPGGVARPRYDTEMAVSTWPSICTRPTSQVGLVLWRERKNSKIVTV